MMASLLLGVSIRELFDKCRGGASSTLGAFTGMVVETGIP